MLVLPGRPFGARECKLELEVSISASALNFCLAHLDRTTAAGKDGPSPQPSPHRMGRGRTDARSSSLRSKSHDDVEPGGQFIQARAVDRREVYRDRGARLGVL